MLFRIAILFLPLSAQAADLRTQWDRAKAFEYLETRQQEWAAWKPAQKAGGACVSCHTGLSYMAARRAAGERKARPAEEAVVAGVRTRLLTKPPGAMLNDHGVEAILNLLALSLQRTGPADQITPAEREALKRLWSQQHKDGAEKGAWSWFQFDLHPVESEHSVFYGATLAEWALSAYPASEDEAGGRAALRAYLKQASAGQPLHNRLAWLAFRSENDGPSRKAILKELWAAQADDGGFPLAALGPWSPRPDAPPTPGSSAYATAWAAFTAQRAGVSCSDGHLRRALAWLASHQDAATGAWHAPSMNKRYPEGSTQLKFHTDATTGYAAAALLACEK